MLKVWLMMFLIIIPGVGFAAEADKPVVYFTVIPRYNPMVMYRSYQPIMDYLTESTPYHFELKLAHNYTEAVEYLKNGDAQLASLGDVTFFEASRGFGAVPLVRPLNKLGRAEYRSIIVVGKDSPLATLAELRGQSFAFGNSHSTSGNLIPRTFLSRHGLTLFDLGHYENLDSHDAVAKAVLKGKFAAGAVKDVVAQRYEEHGLRYLAASDPIPSVPIVVRPDADPQLVATVRQALLAIDPADPAMQERMRSWDPEFRNGFVSAEQSDYEMIFQLMESIPEGCGSRCH